MKGNLCLSGLAILVAVTGMSLPAAYAVNIADFGEVFRSPDGREYGVMWEDPREIHELSVVFATDAPKSLKVKYWQSSWPYRRPPRDAASGAGSSGWFDMGDWYQGKAVEAVTEPEVAGSRVVFRFGSLKGELPDLKDFDADYRTTFRIWITGEDALPEIILFEPKTDAVWKPLDVDILWRKGCAGNLSVFNGAVEGVWPVGPRSGVVVDSEGRWTSKADGGMDGIRARMAYAEPGHYHSFDETVVTVHAGEDTFSFAPKDLLRWKRMVLPDFGVLIRLTGDTTDYATALSETEREKDIYSRVLDMPEQTFPNAWNDMPEKARHYIPLSFEGGRQHFRLDPSGEVFCNKSYVKRLRGKDTDRCLWKGDQIGYTFGLSSDEVTDRELIDGYLPITVTTWERDGVRYKQTAFVTPLWGVPEPGGRIEADDTLVMMLRFSVASIAGDEREVVLPVGVLEEGKKLKVAVDDGKVMVTEGDPARLAMLTSAEVAATAGDGAAVLRVALTPARPSREFDVAIPFISFVEPEEGDEWARLRGLRFDTSLAQVRDWWRGRVEQSAQIVTPEPMINDFYRAHVPHMLINTEREVGGALRYMARVGTFRYGVYANESCMMVSDLDRRGFHERAQEAIETWLYYQGKRALPGTYSTHDGVFYSAGGYEDDNGYNQHHGWVLWCIGEHYWYTRDAAWLEHAAPNIVKACDWIINERRSTIEIAAKSPLRAIEKGLLPQGSLEDIHDWRTWLSTNVYSWWGMNNAAAVLAAANHPEGARLLAEAAAYKRDLVAAVMESMRRSPVVRLRSGVWIPQFPSDIHRRGRSFGWITETLEGSIHLVRCGVFEPWDRASTWIIQDFEDNRYLSEQFGYNMTGAEFERYWFSRGGISMQANLLCNPIPYLLRDEPEHFLRAYFNAFAASYFPDTRMMTEHALPNIGDWRGDHYKTSDEANSTYWLRMMFVQERGNDLWVGAAIPRYWFSEGREIGIQRAGTYFGPTSVTYRTNEDGSITAMLEPPKRNPPERIFVRFRHPGKKPIARCEVDGKPVAFDAKKEWVELRGVTVPVQVTAFF